MKWQFVILICTALFPAAAQSTSSAGDLNAEKTLLTVNAGCGQCRFDLTGQGCDLAIEINGKAYYVKGAHIDQFGDAHADDGFCNSTRRAEVQGRKSGKKFKASYFRLLPPAGSEFQNP